MILPFPIFQPIQGTAIVVMQLGSSFLRIGRAADTYPQTIPHCIARRHKNPGKQRRFEDAWLMRTECFVCAIDFILFIIHLKHAYLEYHLNKLMH